MSRIEVIQWEFAGLSGNKFFEPADKVNNKYKCLTSDKRLIGSEEAFKDLNYEFEKPSYSEPDMDIRGTINGRRSYYPTDYSKSSSFKSIFDILAFEDKIILKTLVCVPVLFVEIINLYL